MSTGGLYPDPPHLTVAVYSRHPEERSFAAFCDLARQAGCRPTGRVEVAPWDVPFEYRSDLADIAAQLTLDPARLTTVLAGQDTARRAVRAGFIHRTHGIAVVEYLPAPAPDRHPIGLSVSAGALGIPEHLHARTDRSAARTLARWTTTLLREASARCDAEYGGIGVELRLGTPGQLRAGSATIPSELFVSHRLLTADPALESALRAGFSPATQTTWPHGAFFTGWRPFSRGDTLPDIPHRFRASSTELGNATRQ